MLPSTSGRLNVRSCPAAVWPHPGLVAAMSPVSGALARLLFGAAVAAEIVIASIVAYVVFLATLCSDSTNMASL